MKQSNKTNEYAEEIDKIEVTHLTDLQENELSTAEIAQIYRIAFWVRERDRERQSFGGILMVNNPSGILVT